MKNVKADVGPEESQLTGRWRREAAHRQQAHKEQVQDRRHCQAGISFSTSVADPDPYLFGSETYHKFSG